MSGSFLLVKNFIFLQKTYFVTKKAVRYKKMAVRYIGLFFSKLCGIIKNYETNHYLI